jgi:hypothetical protein
MGGGIAAWLMPGIIAAQHCLEATYRSTVQSREIYPLFPIPYPLSPLTYRTTSR